MQIGGRPDVSAYLELCVKACSSCVVVLVLESLDHSDEVTGWDLRVATTQALQYSVMDEDILVLRERVLMNS